MSPALLALDKVSGKVLEVGAAAKKMLGRTPGNIVAARPLKNGAISDYDMTATMLSVYLKRITKMSLVKPRVVVSVPSGITEVEERAVIQATMEAGARRVYSSRSPWLLPWEPEWIFGEPEATWSLTSAAVPRILRS